MNKKSCFLILVVAGLLLTGCSKKNSDLLADNGQNGITQIGASTKDLPSNISTSGETTGNINSQNVSSSSSSIAEDNNSSNITVALSTSNDSENKTIANNNNGVIDASDVSNNSSGEADFSGKVLKSIFFAYNEYVIDGNYSRILINNKIYFQNNKPKSIVIEGNCDEIGNDEFNYALGLKRAESVKKWYEKEGMKNIKIITNGEDNPICTEHNEECWQKNRRVDFKVQR